MTYPQKNQEFWYTVIQGLVGKLYLLSLFYIMYAVICTSVIRLADVGPVTILTFRESSSQHLFQHWRYQSRYMIRFPWTSEWARYIHGPIRYRPHIWSVHEHGDVVTGLHSVCIHTRIRPLSLIQTFNLWLVLYCTKAWAWDTWPACLTTLFLSLHPARVRRAVLGMW